MGFFIFKECLCKQPLVLHVQKKLHSLRQREGVTMKHALLFTLVCSIPMCYKFIQASFDETVYLERARRGIVPCPPITSGRVSLEDADAVYWYKGQIQKSSLLISYFRGNIAPQNGISEGVYDIDSEFSLIIETVSPADEEIYYCRVKPKVEMVHNGHVGVYEKVLPHRPFPIVTWCHQRPPDPDQCIVPIETDTAIMRSLTCTVEAVKPAVELSWFRVFQDGSEELVDASHTIKPVVLPPNEGPASRNNTFSTSSTIQLASVNDDVTYRCEAHGVAVGNGSNMTVSFQAPSTTGIYSESQPPENAGAPTNKSSAITTTVMIVLGVTIFILVTALVFVIRLYLVSRQWNRHKDMKFASETINLKPAPNNNDGGDPEEACSQT